MHPLPDLLTFQCGLASCVNQSTRNQCDTRLSVGESWHSTNPDAKYTSEEGFFTEWKPGNTPNEKPRTPAFGGVFFCLRIKNERVDTAPQPSVLV